MAETIRDTTKDVPKGAKVEDVGKKTGITIPQASPAAQIPPQNPENPNVVPGSPPEPHPTDRADWASSGGRYDKAQEQQWKDVPDAEPKAGRPVAEVDTNVKYRPLRPGEAKPVAAQNFIYLGDHDSTVMYGQVFERGKPTAVTDPVVIGKLSNNAEFTDGSDKDRLKEAQRLNMEADKAKGEREARERADAERLRNQRA